MGVACLSLGHLVAFVVNAFGFAVDSLLGRGEASSVGGMSRLGAGPQALGRMA